MWRKFPKILHIGGRATFQPDLTLNSKTRLCNIAQPAALCLPVRQSKSWQLRQCLMCPLAGLFPFQQPIQLNHQRQHFIRIFFIPDLLCDVSPIARLRGHKQPPF